MIRKQFWESTLIVILLVMISGCITPAAKLGRADLENDLRLLVVSNIEVQALKRAEKCLIVFSSDTNLWVREYVGEEQTVKSILAPMGDKGFVRESPLTICKSRSITRRAMWNEPDAKMDREKFGDVKVVPGDILIFLPVH
jgi:hypothetical protein